MNIEYQKETQSISLTEAIKSLPVFDDDLYLSMQAMNLGIVDDFLADLERQFLREYMETEKTPLPDAFFVSALSQMWIFAVYELLRTWRQRCRKIIQFSEELGGLRESARDTHIAQKQQKLKDFYPYDDDMGDHHWWPFERVANDEDFAKRVQNAFDSSEHLFRKIEALRIHLAKHEMPKKIGSFDLAPGYGRIHMSTGSIYWQVLLTQDEVDLISRREIADLCRRLIEDKSQYMLPPDLQKKTVGFPNLSYGAKRVTLRLSDGSEYHKVFVL